MDRSLIHMHYQHLMKGYLSILLAVCFLISLSSAQVTTNQQYDYIIVGAGLAGLGASEILTENGIKHLMIEASTKIGGRVDSFEFAGETHDLGSREIHYPKGQNTIHDFVEENNVTTIEADFFSEAAYYVNKSQVETSGDLIPAVPVIIRLENYITEQVNSGNYSKDIPLNILIDKFWQQNPNITGYLKDRVNQFMQIVIFATGANLDDIDAYERMPHPIRFFDDDYTVKGGLHKLVKQMYTQLCKPDLHTAEIVYRVDYLGPKIKVYTTRAVYEASHVFLSFPLGILKKNWIHFVPSLPQDKQHSIDNLGFGVLERLYVTFREQFWPDYAGTVTFTGKDKLSRYPFSWVCKDSAKNMLVFTITGDVAVQIEALTKQQVKSDLLNFLKKYLSQKPVIEDLHLTRWHHNSLSMGSVTYMKVGADDQDILNLKRPIEVGNSSKMWFIGEHTSPAAYSYAHGAHQSGRQAASQALGL